MSDVWKGLEERLKQKAKTANEIIRVICVDHLGYSQYYIPCHDFSTKDKREWVRLEDVKEAIQQLKQNYVLVEKSKLDDLLRQFPLQPLGLGALEMGSKLEFLNWFKRLKELLKK